MERCCIGIGSGRMVAVVVVMGIAGDIGLRWVAAPMVVVGRIALVVVVAGSTALGLVRYSCG